MVAQMLGLLAQHGGSMRVHMWCSAHSTALLGAELVLFMCPSAQSWQHSSSHGCGCWPTELVHTAATVASQAEPHLLSSSTELRDSIHSGSTSPSQMIQERCCSGSLATALAAAVRMPSDHSRVSASMCPAEHPYYWDPGCCYQNAIGPDIIKPVPHVTSHVIRIAAMPLRHWLLPSSCHQTAPVGLHALVRKTALHSGTA